MRLYFSSAWHCPIFPSKWCFHGARRFALRLFAVLNSCAACKQQAFLQRDQMLLAVVCCCIISLHYLSSALEQFVCRYYSKLNIWSFFACSTCVSSSIPIAFWDYIQFVLSHSVGTIVLFYHLVARVCSTLNMMECWWCLFSALILPCCLTLGV